MVIAAYDDKPVGTLRRREQHIAPAGNQKMIVGLLIPQPVTKTTTLCRLQKTDGKSRIVFILY
jgi:hypothetical protein